MTALTVLLFLARLPAAGASMVLTLHVVVSLGRGYGQAGLVGAAVTIGMALGSPYLGRVVDRWGLRPMLVLATVGETAFWLAVRHLPYQALLPVAFLGGLVALPVMSVGRQAIAAAAPPDLRRAGYSVDSVASELTWVVSPVVAVVAATRLTPAVATTLLGFAVLVSGSALLWLNPKVRPDSAEPAGSGGVALRTWLTPRLLAVYVIAGGAVFVLSGVDVSLVASLRGSGQLDWTGVAVALTAVASALGGIAYGALRRAPGQLRLMVLLSALIIPAGAFFGGQWWVLALALVPGCAVCAPTVAATGEAVSSLAPPSASGVAAGMQSSAFTTGAALGSPVVGFVLDHTNPGWGFAAAGVGGLLFAVVAWVLARAHRTPAERPGDRVATGASTS
ncbi:MFS transporter [Actinokineospora bangkokensis]|uniref:MFS transporter n=2 Tax=Actinokineospora bangkokensis TaxID=1193682 RepID=A0A1Q9LDY8_9PSEU|nr:MFS transporter [Actinokineospora bangkokensis]